MSFLTLSSSDSILSEVSDNNPSILVMSYWHATPHLETDYEIILTMLKRGNTVLHLDPSDILPVSTCTDSGTSSYRSSLHAVLSSFSNYRYLQSHTNIHARYDLLETINTSYEIEDLSSIIYKGFVIGPCIKAYVIDQLRTATPPPDQISPLACQAFLTATLVIDILEHYIQCSTISAGIIFNGRYPAAWAFRQFFLAHNISVYYHERGSTIYSYQLLDHMPHDYYSWLDSYNILRATNGSLTLSDLKQAENWLSNKISKQDQQSKNFGLSAQIGLTNSLNLPHDKIIITYFTVSFDEWMSLPSEIYPRSVWPDEFSALHSLLSIVNNFPEIHLILRVHPNNLNKHPMDQHRIHNTFLPSNATLVPADSLVDSYELLSISHSIFTYGSSIGYEAAYLGKPVYIFGRCFYDTLDGIKSIKSYANLLSIISQLPRKNSQISQKLLQPPSSSFYYYAFLRNQASIPFSYYQPNSSMSGHFLGIPSEYMQLLR